jgi:hypothetical protein
MLFAIMIDIIEIVGQSRNLRPIENGDSGFAPGSIHYSL